jgi:hypothetical protein
MKVIQYFGGTLGFWKHIFQISNAIRKCVEDCDEMKQVIIVNNQLGDKSQTLN